MAARAEDLFDWRNPDYGAIFAARVARLKWLRENPRELPRIKRYYRTHLADFICDWGMTYDPRNVGTTHASYMPFLLQPKQRDLVEWILELWRAKKSGILEKSRDVGASWVAMALAISMCVLWENVSIGFGSATEIKLDRSGDPDCLFWKGRMFVDNLPKEFRGGCDISIHSPDKRILFPQTNASVTGEVGDKIGHGGRKTFYFVDEAAHLEHFQFAESGLSGTTDTCIWLSSVSIDGMANAFSVKRFSDGFANRTKPKGVFTLHWRDDLRKDDEWAKRKKADLDPVVWAANYDIDYTGSAERVILPYAWAQQLVDAHLKLKIKPTGIRRGALDLADDGKNLNAIAARYGILITHLEAWKGPLIDAVEQACLLCDEWGLDGFDYDSDGMGHTTKGIYAKIAERRRQQRNGRVLRVTAFAGSGPVYDPERVERGTELKNKDAYQNMKAQGWFHLRWRAHNTMQALAGREYDPEALMSIDSRIPDVQKILIELSQPQWKLGASGKRLVDKVPEGAISPDRADAVMMAYAPRRKGLKIDERILEDED